MTMIAFDTLDASKRLREAGMDERMAEAIVGVVQQTAVMPSIDHLATKDDLDALRLATRMDIAELRADVTEKIRLQGWAMMGGTATIVAIATAIIKLA